KLARNREGCHAMNRRTAMKIINLNDKTREGSFMWDLHEPSSITGEDFRPADPLPASGEVPIRPGLIGGWARTCKHAFLLRSLPDKHPAGVVRIDPDPARLEKHQVRWRHIWLHNNYVGWVLVDKRIPVARARDKVRVLRADIGGIDCLSSTIDGNLQPWSQVPDDILSPVELNQRIAPNVPLLES